MRSYALILSVYNTHSQEQVNGGFFLQNLVLIAEDKQDLCDELTYLGVGVREKTSIKLANVDKTLISQTRLEFFNGSHAISLFGYPVEYT